MNRSDVIECEEMTPFQKELVYDTLHSILHSRHFSKSKRYPALLEYIVFQTLSGETDNLKERPLAAKIFDRQSNYDPNADSGVRTAAGEIRRRIAAYFSEHPEAPVRIDLPIGGYVAEFTFSPPVQQPVAPEPAQASVTEILAPHPPLVSPARPVKRSPIAERPVRAAAFALFVLAIAGAASWSYLHNRARRDFWSPVLSSGRPVVVVVGRSDDHPTAATLDNAQAANLTGQPAIVLQDVRAVAQVCDALYETKKNCEIASARAVTLDDMRGKSVVLIGAYNNTWTPTILESLPYQIPLRAPLPSGGPAPPSIVERKNNGEIQPVVTRGALEPGATFNKDYAIIARFYSPITEGMVVVIAGLGPAGTQGAGEFVSSPEQMANLASLAQKSWKGTDFEAVLQVDVVRGSVSSAKAIRALFW